MRSEIFIGVNARVFFFLYCLHILFHSSIKVNNPSDQPRWATCTNVLSYFL